MAFMGELYRIGALVISMRYRDNESTTSRTFTPNMASSRHLSV